MAEGKPAADDGEGYPEDGEDGGSDGEDDGVGARWIHGLYCCAALGISVKMSDLGLRFMLRYGISKMSSAIYCRQLPILTHAS